MIIRYSLLVLLFITMSCNTLQYSLGYEDDIDVFFQNAWRKLYDEKKLNQIILEM